MKKSKNNVSISHRESSKVIAWVRCHSYELLLLVAAGLFIIYFSVISVLRHNNFYTGRFDLGNMDQTIWNTINGRFFELTDPNGTEIVSRLAFHADYLLVLLAPLYLLWEDPQILLITQAAVIGLGSVFVYLLARDSMKNKAVALVLSISYLLNPSVERSILYDFHAVTLATTFLLGAFYFLYKKKYIWFLVFAVLAGITKEQIWLIIALLGVYISVQSLVASRKEKEKHLVKKILLTKQTLLGIVVFLASGFLFYFFIWQAIPKASNSYRHFALSYFSEANDSPSTLVKNVVLSPGNALSKILQSDRKEYLQKLLLPVGYAPLIAPWYLVFPSADLGLNLLSDKDELHQIYYQYTAAITPFLFIASLFAIKYLKKLIPVIPSAVYAFYFLSMAIFGSYLYGPFPGSRDPSITMFTKPQENKEYIKSALDQINPSYIIAATNNLGAQLSQRQYISTLPLGKEKADVIALLLTESSNDWERKTVEELKQDASYAVWFEKGNFIVFKKI